MHPLPCPLPGYRERELLLGYHDYFNRKRLLPLPCTQGRGRGRGFFLFDPKPDTRSPKPEIKIHPLPSPLPGYRERELLLGYHDYFNRKRVLPLPCTQGRGRGRGFFLFDPKPDTRSPKPEIHPLPGYRERELRFDYHDYFNHAHARTFQRRFCGHRAFLRSPRLAADYAAVQAVVALVVAGERGG